MERYRSRASTVVLGLAAIAGKVTVSAGYAFGYVSEKTMSDASSSVSLGLLGAFLGLSWFLSRRLERAPERK